MSNPQMNQFQSMIEGLKADHEARIHVLEHRVSMLENTIRAHGMVSPGTPAYGQPFALGAAAQGRGMGRGLAAPNLSVPESTPQFAGWDMQRMNLRTTTGTKENASFLPYAIAKLAELATNAQPDRHRGWQALSSSTSRSLR